MKLSPFKNILLLMLLVGGVAFLFQNCGPAKLSLGDSPSANSAAAVGTQVNLSSLLSSPPENPVNVLYPSSNSVNSSEYDANTPILENIVLATNDFSSIEWVYAPTSTVVASGTNFNANLMFSQATAGLYYVFGFRGSTSYLIAEYQLSARPSNSTGAISSLGATQISSTLEAVTTQSTSYLVEIDAPAVDFNSIQFAYNGQTVSGVRAILVTLQANQAVTVQATLTDTSGNSFSVTADLSPTTGIPSPTPVPLASPTPTPVPTITSDLPDLIVTAVGMSPQFPTADDAILFNAVVYNQGTVATPGGVAIQVTFWVDGKEVTWSDNQTSPLSPGTSVTVTANGGPVVVQTVNLTAGIHTIMAWVNSSNLFSESNTSNNQLSTQIIILP